MVLRGRCETGTERVYRARRRLNTHWALFRQSQELAIFLDKTFGEERFHGSLWKVRCANTATSYCTQHFPSLLAERTLVAGNDPRLFRFEATASYAATSQRTL